MFPLLCSPISDFLLLRVRSTSARRLPLIAWSSLSCTTRPLRASPRLLRHLAIHSRASSSPPSPSSSRAPSPDALAQAARVAFVAVVRVVPRTRARSLAPRRRHRRHRRRRRGDHHHPRRRRRRFRRRRAPRDASSVGANAANACVSRLWDSVLGVTRNAPPYPCHHRRARSRTRRSRASVSRVGRGRRRDEAGRDVSRGDDLGERHGGRRRAVSGGGAPVDRRPILLADGDGGDAKRRPSTSYRAVTRRTIGFEHDASARVGFHRRRRIARTDVSSAFDTSTASSGRGRARKPWRQRWRSDTRCCFRRTRRCFLRHEWAGGQRRGRTNGSRRGTETRSGPAWWPL